MVSKVVYFDLGVQFLWILGGCILLFLSTNNKLEVFNGTCELSSLEEEDESSTCMTKGCHWSNSSNGHEKLQRERGWWNCFVHINSSSLW